MSIPCKSCSGQTGIHEMGCPEMDTRVVFFMFNPDGTLLHTGEFMDAPIDFPLFVETDDD